MYDAGDGGQAATRGPPRPFISRNVTMSSTSVVPVPGLGGLPRIELAAADGPRAEIYLHGAHVTSWFPAGATDDRLFVSTKAIFADDAPIRGGVPICFPQFADQVDGTKPESALRTVRHIRRQTASSAGAGDFQPSYRGRSARGVRN